MNEINNRGEKKITMQSYTKLKSIYGFRITFMFVNCCIPDFFFSPLLNVVPPTWLRSIVTHTCVKFFSLVAEN